MKKEERENWQLIKDALEKSNKTECLYYTRAVAIVNDKDDPFDELK